MARKFAFFWPIILQLFLLLHRKNHHDMTKRNEPSSELLVGRKSEIKHLEAIMESKEAEFAVVYGRRRVGKTFLVNTFFNDDYAFKLTGLAKKGKRDQLANFTASRNRYGNGRKFI